jgi:UDP-glucuronate 4-epimerase
LDTRAVIERQPAQPGDVPQTFADVSKARSLLGYNPQTEIEEGIRRFVDWFRAKPGERESR